MARNNTCKNVRRVGVVLEVKSSNKEARRVDTPPGQHGQQRKGRSSEYGNQLKMKQTVKYYYGLTEKQFRRFYSEAARRKGSTSDNLLFLLESRLDNLVYRMGFARTRAEARQLVNHGAVRVNDKKVNIPSYLIQIGDHIAINSAAKKQSRIAESLSLAKNRPSLEWLEINEKDMIGKMLRLPEINELPSFKMNLVVELYSK